MVTKKSTTKKRSTKSKTSKAPKRMDVCEPTKSCSHMHCKATGGCIWFLGFVGALVYYLSVATSFWTGVLGVLKAIVWPAMLVFKLLGL